MEEKNLARDESGDLIEKPPFAPGQMFRGLLIHSVLGEGGMGYAYLASHPVLAAPVVIKTFKLATADQPMMDPSAPAGGSTTDHVLGALGLDNTLSASAASRAAIVSAPSIFAEARLAARALSPHVVAVLDAGEEAGTGFIVQRYVDGIDLEELLASTRRAGRRLPTEVVIKLLLDTSSGLHAIHLAGVVHRDIKLENIFLCGSGETMIGDFGIAVDRNDRAARPHAGTPQFMAPEQWLHGAIDARADLYALGATAHFLLTGEPPFQGDTLERLMAAHALRPYAPPQAKEPREAYLFCMAARMLQKRPEHRYSSAGVIVRLLQSILVPPPDYRSAEDGKHRVGDLVVTLGEGDLAATEADVIVNAANVALRMELGVAAALLYAGGEVVQTEAQAQAPARMGDVVWTGAGNLNAKWVAHAVAAIEGAICLGRTTLRSLLGAEERGAVSIAFPALGTGVGGVPMALAAKKMLEAIRTFAALKPGRVRDIRVVLFDATATEQWKSVLQSMCIDECHL